ncbi:Ricin B-like lectin [Abortiporus biennis]
MASVQSGGVYILVNAKSGGALDLSGGDNRSIIGYDVHGSDNQKWRLEQVEGGQWRLQNVASGAYLRVDGYAQDGTPVVAPQGDGPFEWDIWPDEDDPNTFRIFVPNTRLNIDLSDHGNPTPGTPITLWNKWAPGINQRWRFQQA